MATDLEKLDREVRFWFIAAVATLVGLRLAVDVYSGPSIVLGLVIVCGIALAAGLLSLWFGERVRGVVGDLLSFL